MEYFHHITVNDYLRQWDRDRDGLVDRRYEDGRRGIASYDESKRNPNYLVAADLLGAEYAAFTARSHMLMMKGEAKPAKAMLEKAQQLQALYETEWWNEKDKHFASVKFQDGSYGGEYVGMDAFMPLYYGILRHQAQINAQVNYIIKNDRLHNQEERSYVPEILWRYKADEAAFDIFSAMTAPDYLRREYPEISFAALGAIASGYMGAYPNAQTHSLSTRSAILDNGYAELNYLPLWGGHIHLMHEGKTASTLENLTGSDLLWQPVFERGTAKPTHVPAGATIRLSQDKV
jgi:hypothetical protein